MTDIRFRVYVSEDGNVYMREIAELVQAALQDLSDNVELISRGLPTLEAGAVNLVVAPHDYFDFQKDASIKERLEAARYCIPIAVEQPSTLWFARGLRYCLQAPFVLDINQVGVAAFKRHGIKAHRLPLGYHSSWDVWQGESSKERTIDVLFMGAMFARRAEFFARNSGILAALNCRLMFFDPEQTQVGGKQNFLVGKEKFDLLANAKVIINIHQSANPYFEWHRLIPALANGCVVLTESSLDYAPLRAFEHFIEAPLEDLAPYAFSLVKDEERRQALAAETHGFISKELSLTKLLAGFMPLFRQQAARPRVRRVRRMSTAKLEKAVAQTGEFGQHESLIRRRARRAREILINPISWRLANLEQASLQTQSVLKTILVNQISLKRKLESLQSQAQHGSAEACEIFYTPAFERIQPDTSVVIPLYNYEEYIEEALESILACTGVTPEILVVDDHSEDKSGAVARDFMERHQDVPMMLMSRYANQGSSAARNLGFRQARCEHIFLLDADNTVYPDALKKLKQAVEDPDAAFAYCMIERYGDPDIVMNYHLMSYYPWEVDRLVLGNYIDNMTLIKKSAWQAAGGFPGEMDRRFSGWEDYALWLALAERGFKGVLVPEVLARYRCHPGSQLSIASLEVKSIFDYLRVKYRKLPWTNPY